MITIDHALTQQDVDLVTRYFARITYEQRISPPFRMILGGLGMFILVQGVLLSSTKPVEGVFAMAMAFICLYLAIWPILIRRTLNRIHDLLHSRVGSVIRYEIDEAGIKYADHHLPWRSFRSFMDTEAGIVMGGKELIFIPAAALADQALKTQLRDFLSRHVREKQKA
jgi:hypothetical protein